MTRDEAQIEWNRHVAETADAWRQEFGDDALDEEWSGTAFADVPGEIIEVLGLDDPWRDFHNDVEDAINV